MTKVLSVNDRAKVWEIKKFAERFVISGLTLTKSAIGAGVDHQQANGVLGGVEEVERQWADRVLERLNNAGGKQRVVQ